MAKNQQQVIDWNKEAEGFLENKVKNYLKWYCRGYLNTVTNRELANKMLLPERHLRYLIAKMVTIDGSPIGSRSGHGIFWIPPGDIESFEVGTREIKLKIIALSRRLHKLSVSTGHGSNTLEHVFGQIRMELE